MEAVELHQLNRSGCLQMTRCRSSARMRAYPGVAPIDDWFHSHAVDGFLNQFCLLGDQLGGDAARRYAPMSTPTLSGWFVSR